MVDNNSNHHRRPATTCSKSAKFNVLATVTTHRCDASALFHIWWILAGIPECFGKSLIFSTFGQTSGRTRRPFHSDSKFGSDIAFTSVWTVNIAWCMCKRVRGMCSSCVDCNTHQVSACGLAWIFMRASRTMVDYVTGADEMGDGMKRRCPPWPHWNTARIVSTFCSLHNHCCQWQCWSSVKLCATPYIISKIKVIISFWGIRWHCQNRSWFLKKLGQVSNGPRDQHLNPTGMSEHARLKHKHSRYTQSSDPYGWNRCYCAPRTVWNTLYRAIKHSIREYTNACMHYSITYICVHISIYIYIYTHV